MNLNKRTPLYTAHLAAGAKMVDFAGWDMPIHYGSQIEEHHRVRRTVGMFDVSHMRAIDVTGNDARLWLRTLLANDVAKLVLRGKALYSCLLNDQGGVIDDLIVYGFDPGHYRIVVNAGTADKDLAWMRTKCAGRDVSVVSRPELAMIAIQGPQAREKFWTAFPASRDSTSTLPVFQAATVGDWMIARTGYTGEDGFELTLPADQAETAWHALQAAGVAPCGLGARDTLRLEAGMNLYGQDMDETTTPLETGLAWTLDLRDPERRFVGREALEQRPPTRGLFGLLLLDRGVLRAHQIVHTAHGDGEITSGSFSPTLGQSIALARLPRALALGDNVNVVVRDKHLAARIVKPVFVRHGQSQL